MLYIIAAAALSVGSDHPSRHRHHSGMSDDEDDVLKDQNYVIEVKDGNFSWDLEKQELSLKNINVSIPQGEGITVFRGCKVVSFKVNICQIKFFALI